MDDILVGGKWYYALSEGKGALLNKHKKTPGCIVVRRVTMSKLASGEEKLLNTFGMFKSEEDLHKYILSLPADQRDLHEIFEEKEFRKPYLDIDISCAKWKITEEQADSHFTVLSSKLKELLDTEKNKYRMYTSHGPDKRSGHVVLTGRYQKNSEESKEFYEQVVSLLPEELRKFVDPKVYSVKQNWRLLYCGKLGTNRPKVLEGSNEKEMSLEVFKESIVRVS